MTDTSREAVSDLIRKCANGVEGWGAVTADTLRALMDERDIAQAQIAKAVEALLWCSGSADFNEGGVAREGWLKLCAPLIAELKEDA